MMLCIEKHAAKNVSRPPRSNAAPVVYERTVFGAVLEQINVNMPENTKLDMMTRICAIMAFGLPDKFKSL